MSGTVVELAEVVPGIAADTLRTAERHLAAIDPVMAQLVARHGPCRLGVTPRAPFHVLCTSIIGQQLSTKAADTIQARVAVALAATDGLLHPTHFHGSSVEALRACGLSYAKARWLLELAARAHDGRFDAAALAAMDDAALIDALDALPGIGRWTAEMMLMFAFHRLDVFSLGDVALRRGVDRLYSRPGRDGKPKPLDEKKTLKVAQRWSPYRTVACWYLWRSLDGDSTTWA